MDKRPWAEDENLGIEKEENLQADRERAENRKTVRRVFGRVALGLSAMIIAVPLLMEVLAPAILDEIPGGENDFNVVFLISVLILYSVGIITYLVLKQWVPNAPAEPFDEKMQTPTEIFGNDMQPEQWADHKTELSRPRKLTLGMGSKLVVICLALGFVFNLITMGINYGINLFNHAREVREITQQYLETGYEMIPEPPYFLEADPLLEVVGRLNPILAFLIIVVTTSIFEEMIFRKLLYDKLNVFGGKVFVIVSSLLFALFHQNHRQLIYTFVVGLVFAGVMYYTQKVSYCILLHMAFNSFGTLAMYVQEMSEMIQGVFGILSLGLLVTGIVFLIKGIVTAKRWATFEPAQIEVKKRGDIFFNPGMIIFIVLSIAGMIGNALYFAA